MAKIGGIAALAAGIVMQQRGRAPRSGAWRRALLLAIALLRSIVLAASRVRRAALGAFLLCAALAPATAWASGACNDLNSGSYSGTWGSGTTSLTSVLNGRIGDIVQYSWTSRNSAYPYIWSQSVTYVSGRVIGSGSGSGSFRPTATDYSISYGNNGQGGSVSFVFSCIPMPLITSLNTTSGPASGGTTVTVTGADFVSGATVLVDGAAASNVTVLSKTSLRFVTPPHAVGVVNVQIANAGGSTATLNNAYTYVPSSASTITSLSATAGPIAGGTNVTATGTGFVAGSTSITIGSVTIPAASVTVNSPTSLSFVTPAQAAGNVLVTATMPDGVTDPVPGGFTYLAVPVGQALTPTNGAPAGGTSVFVIGSGFLAGRTSVTIGDTVVPAGSVNASSASLLSFITPAHAVGNVAVTISTPGGTSAPVPGGFTYAAVPAASALSPSSGPIAGNMPVTMTGTNFVAGKTSVTIGGTVIPAASVTVASETSLTFNTPARAAGNVAVTVTNPVGTSTAVPGGFTYVAAPTASTMSPSRGPATGNTAVTLTGTNFVAGSTSVTIGGTVVPAAGVSVAGATSLTFNTPANAAGNVAVTVTTPGGTTGAVPAGFTYVAAPVAGALDLVIPAGVPTPINLSDAITGSHSSIEVTTVPAHGTFTINGDTVTYTPGADFAGPDSFAYRAIGEGGNSPPATVNLTVQPIAQTITFAALADASLSASPLTLSATASSGLAVSFTSATTGICTVTGTALTLIRTGVCTIDANQAGGGSWAVAPTFSRSFTVTPAILELANGSASGASVGGSYSQENTATGGVGPYLYAVVVPGALPPGTSIDSTTGTVSGTPTMAGSFTYAVTVSDSQSPAVSTFGNVSVTITKGDQTVGITSTPPNASVGGLPYTVSAAATSGLAAVLSLDGTSTGCALSGNSVIFTDTGTCRINADQAGDSNWNPATQAQQSFNVGAAGAITASTGFAPRSLAVGATGTTTITFINPNATASAPLVAALNGPALLTRANGAPGGTCMIGSMTSATPVAVQLNDLIVPAGGCIVTLDYIGATPGSTTGFTLSLSTPIGYAPSSAVGSGAFVVVPTVTGISPTSGPVSQVVTISGTGFSTTPGDNLVSFGTAAVLVTAASATSLTVTAPATGSGTAAIGVTVNGQKSIGGASYTFIDKPIAADRNGVAVPYAGTGTMIDLSGSITGGPHSAIAIDTAPTHGIVTITGDVATYTPAATYYGADSFTYIVTGPGGSSAPATVSLDIALPPAPIVTDKAGVAVPYAGTGTAIDLSGSITGVYSSIAIGTAPTHGTVTITGDMATYTPAATYYGADSFTYVATGPGGSSTPATVTLDVAVPPAPTVADRNGVAVPYAGTGTMIDLSGAITGVHSNIAIDTAPAHGTVAVSGDIVTYVPAATYYGADSFTYIATGPGGNSTPATVRLTVMTPTAPGAAGKSVAIPYAGTGTAIDLSGSITGVHSGIEIGTAPAHGTVTVTGDVATYTPAATYYGADSFTYVATGPGGSSAPATVALDVALPSAPTVADKTGVAVPYAGTGTPIDLSGAVSGVYSSIAIDTPPTHGTVSIMGNVATYTPVATHHGADRFTYVATGPGGTSAPATVTLDVAAPPAPTVADKGGVAVPYASTGTTIDLSGLIAGVHSNIAIGTAPMHGTVTISGDVVTYTPAATYYGADRFTYVATGPGGSSAPAKVILIVAQPDAPAVADSQVAVPYASDGTAIDLSGSITGLYASIAIDVAPMHGTVTIAGNVATYTPATTYYGADSFTYIATGPGGSSTPATVRLTVSTPAVPAAAGRTVAIPYAGTGTAIDLSGAITGVHANIAIGTAPTHGTVSIDGYVVTYTPVPTYSGTDSFTYIATGPGGSSAPATVTLEVALPSAPIAADRNDVPVPYAGTGTPIDLSGSITGVYSSIVIGTAPTHGTVTITGDMATYTPAATYSGADSFTYIATGSGGSSAPATVTLDVAVPSAPIAADKTGVAVPYAGTGTPIDLSGSITGVYANIAIGTAPTHGAVTITGDVATYTPAPNYSGVDSFTYVATGPGGGSAPATVTLDIALPSAPIAADKTGVAVPYAGTGTAIDLSGSITGVYANIAIGTAPAHGTVSIAGNVVTYTPATTYYGADSFTYVATGPGGSSAPATVALDVAVPSAPIAADRNGVPVPYAGTGTAIDLSGSITGVYANIAIGTAPAHGTVTMAGDVATYTPAPNYSGVDSFTYVATGPGGGSAPATVTLDIALPSAPTVSGKAGVAVAYNSPGAPIDLSGSIIGVYASIAIDTAPAHGTASVVGDVVTYIPAAGYFGVDSFTWTATGPGGISTAASVGLIVATPPAPVAAPGRGSVEGRTTTAGTSVSIDLSTLVTGVYDTIQIGMQPAHGTVTLSGGPSAASAGIRAVAPAAAAYVATYTPAMNFAGTDSFTFTATGPGGTSAPGTVTIAVAGQVPVAAPRTARTGDGQLVSVMLTDGAVGGPFTGANIVGLTPADSASTAIVASGGGYRLDVTPNNRFGGTIVVSYTLSNAFGASLPSTVTLTVQARPDPRSDPNVAAISDAQAEATRRFARTQVSNFMRRNEQLHHGGGRTGMAMGLTLAARDPSVASRRLGEDGMGQAITDRMRGSGEISSSVRPADDPQAAGPAGEDRAAADQGDGNGDGKRRIGSVASWVGGAIDIGTRDATTDRSKMTATTSGLSAGADIKLAEGVLVGVGGGYGNDLSRIGTSAQVRGKSTLYAAYASVQPGEHLFVDGMIGLGQLDFTTRRLAATVDSIARGKRNGDYTVAALSLGIDRTSGAFIWSLYGRGEYMGADLGAYFETGAGRYNLRFDARRLQSLTGTLGGTIQYRRQMGFGSITPRMRAEWNHEFADAGAQWLDYADIPGLAIYALQGNGWKREQFQLSLGTRFDILKGHWQLDLEAGLRTGQGESATTLQIRVGKAF